MRTVISHILNKTMEALTNKEIATQSTWSGLKYVSNKYDSETF